MLPTLTTDRRNSALTFLPDAENSPHIPRRFSFNPFTVVTAGLYAHAPQYAAAPTQTYLPDEPPLDRSPETALLADVTSHLAVTRAIDIYGSGVDTPVLGRVTRLLDEASERIAHAIAALRDGRAHHADADVQLLHGALPELFSYRNVGDGFGMIIGCLLIGLHNNGGDALSLSQMSAIRDAIDLLREQPFVAPLDAVDATIALEDAGLAVTTRVTTAISSLEPNDEGIS